MPIKVHVKGKRRAPLPPTTTSKVTVTNETTNGPTNSDHRIESDANLANGSNGSDSVDAKSKKKLAPTPPNGVIHHSAINSSTPGPNVMPNNLSVCSSPGRYSRKKYDNHGFSFNIIGAGTSMSSDKCTAKDFDEMASNAKGTPVLKNFRLNLDEENAIDGNDRRGTDVSTVAKTIFANWNCRYCTLENPFWRSVCAVCDNIGPTALDLRMRTAASSPPPPPSSSKTSSTSAPATGGAGTATTAMTSNNLNLHATHLNSNSNHSNHNGNGEFDHHNVDSNINNISGTNAGNNTACNGINHREQQQQQQQQQQQIGANAYDEIYSACENEKVGNTATATAQPYAIDVVYRKKINNTDVDNVLKRNSEIIIKDYPTTTLEMEKQRLRAVIRSMNNRVLAKTYPQADAIASCSTSTTSNWWNRKDTPDYASIDDIPLSVNATDVSKSGAKPKEGVNRNGQRYNDPGCNAMMVDRDRLGTNEAREKATKVSTSVQTDAPVTRANRAPQPPRNALMSDNLSMRSNFSDDYYDFIGNLSMYGDNDLFTNTLRKLENPYADKRCEKAHVPITQETNPFEKSIVVNLYINFNNAVEISVQPSMLLSQLKNKIGNELMPSTEQRIYFNGLLMDKEQTLHDYGVKEKSAIYLNTEGVKVDVENAFKCGPVLPYVGDGMKFVRNDLASRPIKTNNYILNYSTGAGAATVTAKNERSTTASTSRNSNEPVASTSNHIASDEQPSTSNPNLSKNKYRGVYNYNPRCNPTLFVDGEQATPVPALPERPAKRVELKLVTLALPVVADTAVKLRAKSTKSTASTTNTEQNRQSHYMELVQLDNANDIAINTDTFDCVICFLTIERGDGVVLRDCLHTFCRDCIRHTIIYSEEAEVRCPYIDASYTCESLLQDREIKALLTKGEHDEHLAKSLRVAENQIENSFHCRTPNCKGWCIYEDDVNQFLCPICSLLNCLTCGVIHDGLNCKQYQENAKNEEGNADSKTTAQMLEKMVEMGEAMYCPTCHVVLMKKWGCDWLKCSMCKTEICWVTRGPRWGPAGKGDTSAGCKCGIGGFKCHPKCNYCH